MNEKIKIHLDFSLDIEKEDYTYVVKQGAFDEIGANRIGRAARETPEIRRGYKAFVKRAVAINKTSATKWIRIGVINESSAFMQLKECKELDGDAPCEVDDIRLLEYERIVARFDDVKINDVMILRVEGEQWDNRAKDLSCRRS